MQHQDRLVAVDVAVLAHATEAARPSPTPVPRRRLLRALSGVTLGVVALIGLTSCGGEDEEDEEDDD